MSRTRFWKAVCALLLVFNLAFIWGNSLLDGKQSAKLSNGIVAMDSSTQDKGIDELEALQKLVRKAAHLAEFACLGMLLTWGCYLAGTKGVSLYTLPLFGGMTAACIDETIQHFVAGRTSDLLDVWMDEAGALMGMMLFLLGHHVWKKYKCK